MRIGPGLAVGTEITAVAVYMRYGYPAVPGWLWIIAFSAALIAINALHVDVFGTVEYGFSMLKIVAIIPFIALGSYVVFARRKVRQSASPTTHRTEDSFQKAHAHVGRGDRFALQLLQH